jgi:hypothetical protein
LRAHSLLPARRAGVGQAVGVGAGFDDGAVVGESVHDGGAQAGVAEWLAEQFMRWLHPTSGRRLGETFL